MKLIVYLSGLLVALLSSASLQAQESSVIPALPALPKSGDPAVTVTLLKLIESGGPVMLALAALSIVTVTLIVVYLFSLRRANIVSPHFMNTADVLLKKRDYVGLLAISSRHSEAIARITQRMLDFATKNPQADLKVIQEIAETEGATQAASLQHRIIYLADIGMLSPMIGLLGTVFGIIKSFGVLASKQTAENSRNVLLAAGVSEALVATAAGLILGITAMAFYAIFRGRVQSLISDLEIASTHVLSLFAINYNKKRERRDNAASPVSAQEEA